MNMMKRRTGIQKIAATVVVGAAVIGAAALFSLPALAQAIGGPATLPAAQTTVLETQPAPQTAAVQVRVRVAPSRLIVVDENDRIIEVYSNTRVVPEGAYTLKVSEGGQYGPVHPLTEKIQEQYTRILGEVDWSQTGRVYP